MLCGVDVCEPLQPGLVILCFRSLDNREYRLGRMEEACITCAMDVSCVVNGDLDSRLLQNHRTGQISVPSLKLKL